VVFDLILLISNLEIDPRVTVAIKFAYDEGCIGLDQVPVSFARLIMHCVFVIRELAWKVHDLHTIADPQFSPEILISRRHLSSFAPSRL